MTQQHRVEGLEDVYLYTTQESFKDTIALSYEIECLRLNRIHFALDFSGSQNFEVESGGCHIEAIVDAFERIYMGRLVLIDQDKPANLVNKYTWTVEDPDWSKLSKWQWEQDKQILHILHKLKVSGEIDLFMYRSITQVEAYLQQRSPESNVSFSLNQMLEGFIDASFPPISTSIGIQEGDLADRAACLVFRRPKDFMKSPDFSLFANQNTSHCANSGGALVQLESVRKEIVTCSVCQGILPDCWLLSTLNAMSEYPHLIKSLFSEHSQKLSSLGCYELKLCIGGRWRVVLIDDYLPCWPHGTCAFAHSNEHEIWGMLVEKAFAKVHGSYSTLEMGWAHEAMIDLMGVPYEIIRLEEIQVEIDLNKNKGSGNKEGEIEKDDSVVVQGGKMNESTLNLELDNGSNHHVSKYGLKLHTSLTKMSKDRFWLIEKLQKYMSEKAVMTCSTYGEDNVTATGKLPPEEMNGLIPGHSYTLVEVRCLSSLSLVRLRSPWGTSITSTYTWRGDYCATSPKWTPQLRVEIGYEMDRNLDPSTYGFWMNVDDLLKYFFCINVAKVGVDWVEDRRSLCLTYSDNEVLESPMYQFELLEPWLDPLHPIVLSLHQSDERRVKSCLDSSPSSLDIGITLLKRITCHSQEELEKGGGEQEEGPQYEVICSTGHSIDRQVQLNCIQTNPHVHINNNSNSNKGRNADITATEFLVEEAEIRNKLILTPGVYVVVPSTAGCKFNQFMEDKRTKSFKEVSLWEDENIRENEDESSKLAAAGGGESRRDVSSSSKSSCELEFSREMKACLSEMFDRLDRDLDGLLSKMELSKFLESSEGLELSDRSFDWLTSHFDALPLLLTGSEKGLTFKGFIDTYRYMCKSASAETPSDVVNSSSSSSSSSGDNNERMSGTVNASMVSGGGVNSGKGSGDEILKRDLAFLGYDPRTLKLVEAKSVILAMHMNASQKNKIQLKEIPFCPIAHQVAIELPIKLYGKCKELENGKVKLYSRRLGNSGISFAVEYVKFPSFSTASTSQQRQVADPFVGGRAVVSVGDNATTRAEAASIGAGDGGGDGLEEFVDFTFDLSGSINVVSQYCHPAHQPLKSNKLNGSSSSSSLEKKEPKKKLRTTVRLKKGELKALIHLVPKDPLEKWSWKSKYGVKFHPLQIL